MAVTVRRREGTSYAEAECAALDEVGDVVYISGDEVGGLLQVAKINIDVSPAQHSIGVIVLKMTSTRCFVQLGGELRGVYSGLTPGRRLFVDECSRLSHVVPNSPSVGVRLLQAMGTALTSNAVLLEIQDPCGMRP